MNFNYLKRLSSFLFFAALGYSAAIAQETPKLANATLDDLINYALSNKIDLKQAQLDQEIGEREIASALSGWFPQINATASLSHAIQLPTTNINGANITMGQRNNSGLTIQADQAIISPQLFQASKAADFIRQQNELNVENAQINTVVTVSKAYYDILTSEEQIKVILENIARLERQHAEASARYEVGLVDKTDYKRAQISLNNARAELKSARELRGYKYDYLKMLLAIPREQSLSLSFMDQNMETSVLLDTSEMLHIADRVEFRQLQNVKEIQKLNTQYHKWSFLPRVGAYANYSANYRNNAFENLYKDNFPASTVGLSLNLPIFQGTKRIQELRKSELEEERLDLDIQDLENQISTEYSLSMASYRSNMNDWRNAKENITLSEEVYNTIKLQYDAGIKTYLDLMTAETNLKTAQINYLNALYALLSSKLDIQKALGAIAINN
ncbi:TolC family protein [Sphingobacterium sp. SGG-5]|uniref:TolC family protein n=1 Tax=Sphingobacterium sp. SGG-5 TaxID=2710881 RepID=UPI0013EC26B0|nr:TolC family protein [Sphingobacterium sp. SGG-5]NGM62727.1 TolC family protein [Sphingobacterium sp. SGG-5]